MIKMITEIMLMKIILEKMQMKNKILTDPNYHPI